MALAISLIVTVLEMLSGFRSTDPELIKMADTFGAIKRQIFHQDRVSLQHLPPSLTP